MVTGKKGCIAFFYPLGALETFPNLRDAALLLVEQGYQVEIYTLIDNAYPPVGLSDASLSIILNQPKVFSLGPTHLPWWTFGRGGRLFTRILNLYRKPWVHFIFLPQLRRRHRQSPYVCMVGMDTQALVDVAPFSNKLGVPLVYWSLELLFLEEISDSQRRNLKLKEIEYSRQARLTIIQDEWRAQALIAENSLDPSRVFLVPNAPRGLAQNYRTDFLQRKLDIPSGKKIILSSGSLGSWAMIDEIICAAEDWPDDYILVIQSRQKAHIYKHNAPYIKKIQRDINPDKVKLVLDPVSAGDFRALVHSADVGLAFYNPQAFHTTQVTGKPDRNIALMGLSSGKLADYLQAGLPVVVNQITGPKELVSLSRCGLSVESPREIRDALGTIFSDYNAYSDRALACFNEQLEFEKNFGAVLNVLNELNERRKSNS